MGERIGYPRSKNTTSKTSDDDQRLVTKGGRNGTKGARTKFPNIVARTNDEDRIGKIGCASDTTNAT